MIESPIPARHTRGSSDSKQELLRLPIQPNQAHIESMDPVSPILPPQAPQMGLVPKSSNSKRIGGYPEPSEWNTPEQGGGRAYPSDRQRRKQSQDMRTVPYSPGNHRSAYVEDYSDEEDDPRMYRRRTTTRRHQRPPASYDNYADANSRYGPLPGRGSMDSYRGYPETPGKANYETNYTYGSEDEFAVGDLDGLECEKPYVFPLSHTISMMIVLIPPPQTS
jgi:aquaporin related protein